MGTDTSDSHSSGSGLGPALPRDASRHLMIFSYWFPPANAVGSSRPLAMARHFAVRGWRVTVIAGAAQAVPPSFEADLTGFDVHYVPDSWLTRRSSFKAERGVAAQVFRADLDVRLTYRFVRDTVWVAASWYRPGGQHSPEEIARQYLSMVLDGIAVREQP